MYPNDMRMHFRYIFTNSIFSSIKQKRKDQLRIEKKSNGKKWTERQETIEMKKKLEGIF
jgi:hypothetical protein